MRKLRIGIIDLVAKGPTRAWYGRVMHANLASIMPQVIAVWYDLGAKSRTRTLQGMEKVRQVAEHVNLLLRYMPYVQTNFVLRLDVDEGAEPFALTKRFVDLAPQGRFPAIRC